jgi:hypothetical protein
MKKILLLFFTVILSWHLFAQVKFYNAQEYRHSPTDTVSALQKNGNVIYHTGSNRMYVRISGVWRSFTTSAGGGTLSFGTTRQIPVMNSGGTDFSYSATFERDFTDNNFYSGASFTNTNSGTKNNNYVFGTSNQFLGTKNIRWAFVAAEQGILNSNGGTRMHNPMIIGGFNNGILTSGTAESFSCGIVNSNGSSIEALTSNTTSSMIFSGRNDTIQNSQIAFGSGYRAKVTKDGAFMHGFFDTYANGTHTGTIRSCKNDGKHSFGFFTNTSASTDSTGIFADWSAAIGGVNPHIPLTSPYTIIVGGSGPGIKARANDPNQFYCENLNVWDTPAQNDTLTQVLVRSAYDTTGQVYQRYVPLILEGSATLNFGSIAAGATETLTVTVTGAADGDQAIYGIPATAKTAGLIFGTAWVSSSNTVSIEAYNSTLLPIDPNSAVFKVKVFK